MKTLSELRALFVSAREIAKEASPERAGEAAEKLDGISQHCKELYGESSSYLERAKCRNLYESIDNIIEILRKVGFCNETVAAFFGFVTSAKGASFSDISAGRAFVSRADVPTAPATAPTPSLPDVDVSEPAARRFARTTLEMPKPPAPKAAETTAPKEEPTPTPAAEEADAPVEAQPRPTSDAPVAKAGGFDPESFDGFIGQEHIVKRLKEELAAAKKMGLHYLDHILLFGNRGLGKSTLMKIIAKELGVRFEFIDCSSFMNDVKSQRLFHENFVRIANAGEPVVIGLDEIHALPGRLQTALLTLLNDRVYSYVTESGPKNVVMPEFTFIGATTDYDAVLSTIKDRCSNLIFFLEDYKRSELAQILSNKLTAMNLKVDDEKIIERCVNRCRSSIRELNAIVKGLNTKAINRNDGVITMDMVDEYFADRGIDEIGLNKKERMLLEVIQNEPRGTVSGETLAARLYIDPSLLTQEYEPFLLKIGFLSINSRGRALTDKADLYLRHGYYEFSDGSCVGTKPSELGDRTLTTPVAEPAPVAEPSVSAEPDSPAAEPAPVAEPAPAAEPSVSAEPDSPAADTMVPPPPPARSTDEAGV